MEFVRLTARHINLSLSEAQEVILFSASNAFKAITI